MSDLNADEQAIITKARNMASTTTPMGGDADGPPPAPSTPSTPTGGQTEEEVWGPYDTYQMITPPWGGSFGLSPHFQLYFEEKDKLVKGEIRTVKIPRYRDMKAEAAAAVELEATEGEALVETKKKMAESKA